jgi:prophage regulatory protein
MTTPSYAFPTQSAVSYPRRFLRLPEVEQMTGFKRSHIYKLMSDEAFPRQVKLGLRAVAWDLTSIEIWMAERLGSTHCIAS